MAEQMDISRERDGPIIREDLGHGEDLREIGPEMPERGSKTPMVPVVWEYFEIFSARSTWFPVAIGDQGRNLVTLLWPWDKAKINVQTA